MEEPSALTNLGIRIDKALGWQIRNVVAVFSDGGPEQWSEWSDWLAAGLHARNRWRLPVLMTGILFANGRRTVTTWLRATGVNNDYQDYLLLPFQCGTQQQIGRHAIDSIGAPHFAATRSVAVGDRRFADQTVRPVRRRRRRPPQSDAWSGRSTFFVRPRLGCDFACAAASSMGSAGFAVASDALRSQADDCDNSQLAAVVSLCDQASVGSAPGRMDRSHPEKIGKNCLGRCRRRLHQGAVFETCVEALGCRCGGSLAQRRGAARLAAKTQERPTSRSRTAAHRVYCEVAARTKSVWPSELDRRVVGKRSIALFTVK